MRSSVCITACLSRAKGKRRRRFDCFEYSHEMSNFYSNPTSCRVNRSTGSTHSCWRSCFMRLTLSQRNRSNAMKELSSVFKCFERLFRHGRCKIHFNMESSIQGRGLCLTACQLYLQDNNAGGIPNYGWARLRASSLYSWSHSQRRNALPRQAGR